MKNLILTIAVLAITLTTGFSNTNPDSKAKINFQLDKENATAVNVTFNTTENVLSFTTLEEVSFVQVLREDGTLEFQLPLFSNEVIVDLDDFINGKYQVNLLLEGKKMISSTFEK